MASEPEFKGDKEFLDGLPADKRQAFLAWFAELNKANTNERAFYANQPLETATGIECWFSFFEDELSPQEALDEDFACGD